MSTLHHRLPWLVLVGLAASCGGGGGGGGGDTTPAPVDPPTNLVYLDGDRLEVSQVEIAPLLPTFDGDVDAFTVTPALPAGLVIDPSTGVIAGAALAPASRRSYEVEARNASGSAHFALTLQVVAAPRVVYTTSSSDSSFTFLADDVSSGELVRVGQTLTGGIEGTPERLVVHPTGRFAYAPNLATGNVSVFAIDPASGWLAPRSNAACGLGPHSMAIDPAGRFAYVTNRGSDEIYVYAIDSTTGDLTQTTAPITTGTQPSDLMFDPTGELLFVTMRGRDGDGLGSQLQIYAKDDATGSISPFNIALKLNGSRPISVCVDPVREVVYLTLEAFARVLPVRYQPSSGVLAPVSLRPVGEMPVAVGVDVRGRFAYVVSKSSDTIDAFAIDDTTAALSYVGTYGAGSQPSSIALDPTGRFAYVAAGGSHLLITYSIDQATGALVPLDSRLVRGAPAHVTFLRGDHPNVLLPRAVHVTGASSNDVSSYSVDSATGALASIGVAPTGTTPVSIVVDPRNRFAWVAEQGAHAISIFAIDPAGGSLSSSTPAQPVDGQPSHLVVDPSARFLYCVAHDVVDPDDGWLSTFRIDQATGELALMGTTQVGLRPSSVGIEPTGRFIYTANSGTTAPNTTSISVFKLDVDSGLPTLSAPPGTAPGVFGLAFHPGGRFAYAALLGTDTIAEYTIDLVNGRLTIVPPGSFAGPQPVALALTANGRFAYAASIDAVHGGNLALYAVAADGSLGDALQVLQDGVYPSDLAVDPQGRFLYASNAGTDNVSVIRLDPATGAMTALTPMATGVAPGAIALAMRSN